MLALGSRGDVLPCLALGEALVRAGHHVDFITFNSYTPMFAGSPVGFHPIPGDAEALVQQSGINLLALASRFGRAAEVIAAGVSTLGPVVAGSDLLLNQLPGGIYGGELAEKNRVPMALMGVLPLQPTAAFPASGMPKFLDSSAAYNQLTYRLAEQLAWELVRRPVAKLRRQLGLDALPRLHPFRRREALPVLYGFSRYVVPPPPDWGENVQVTGWWFPEQPGWQPPDALERFLEAGQPPVFIGFGSMPMKHPDKVTSLILAALRQTGQRAVLGAGWSGLGSAELPEGVFALDYAPYSWLFPRMAAAVHHGGSGTTGFAVRAGIPSLVVPFLFDQVDWGSRLYKLGVAARPLPFRRLRADALAASLEQIAGNAEMGRRAAALGRLVAQEDGLHRAVQAIENLTEAA